MAKTTKPKKTAKAKAKAKAPAKAKEEETTTAGETKPAKETKPPKEKAPALQTFNDAILRGHAAHFGHYTEKAPRKFKPASIQELKKIADKYLTIQLHNFGENVDLEDIDVLTDVLTDIRKAAR